jgi:phage terminase large subunit-like protein
MRPTKPALDACVKGTIADRRYLCERSFMLFAIYYFSDYFQYSFADFHYAMAEDLHDLDACRIRECAWIEFRESAKTTFAKIFMLWLICFKRRKYINTDSFDSENSERLLFDVVFELTNNARIKHDFGQLYRRSKSLEEIKQNRINNFITENGIRVEAHTTQESMRGRLHLNQRPDCLIIDDFENNKTRDSQAYTKQVEKHISEAMGGMAKNGFILYLGNYITEYGNVQALMDRAKKDTGLRVRNVPVLDAKGRPMWPSKYALTTKEAKLKNKVSIEDKIAQLGSQVFSYEMMNQPIDENLAEFKKDWIQRAKEDDLKHLDLLTFISIDPAASKKDEADYTGIVINRVSKENKWYIRAYRMKINSAELIEHLFYLWQTYKPKTISMEETVYTLAVKPFLDEEMRRRNVFFMVVPLKHGGTKKETRIRGLIPRYESKSIFHVGDCDDLEREMITFPRGMNDDVLDALAYQEQIAHKPHTQEQIDYQPEEVLMFPEIGL